MEICPLNVNHSYYNQNLQWKCPDVVDVPEVFPEIINISRIHFENSSTFTPMTSDILSIVLLRLFYHYWPDVQSILCSKVQYSSKVDIIDTCLIPKLRLIILLAVLWHLLSLRDFCQQNIKIALTEIFKSSQDFPTGKFH